MRTNHRLLALVSVVGLGACGGDGGFGSAGTGATPGGVKDLRLARELIAQGKIPPADALLVEGMFAEHDLPIDGPPCVRTLCLRAAAGIAPELDETPAAFAQVGLSSAVDPATWVQPPMVYIFTVDVSGSMGWGSSGQTPGELSRTLLHRLTDKMRDIDRAAIVTYGSDVDTRLGLTSDRTRLHNSISGLSEDGSTNMEAGMKRAYALAETARAAGTEVRVVVFTDVQPNVGATTPTEFQNIVASAATKDIHTTVIGLGTGIGPEVMRAMATLRGGNAYGLIKPDDITEFMADDFPWFTTPIAYNLRVNVATSDDWSIDRGLGFPAASDAQQIGLKADTVFLSKRRGALLVALAPPATGVAAMTGSFSLAYSEPDGTPITDTVAFGYDGTPVDARGQWFAQHGVARTIALGLLTEAMHDAAKAYSLGQFDDAESLMRTAHDRFAADAEVLADADLGAEVELAAALLALIEARAPQGTLYGQ